MPGTTRTVDLSTAAEWRAWLARHHDASAGVWLVFHKKHTGRPTIAYEDAVDEAICYGWVDSLLKRLDEERYARKFTPRKAESVWSESNRKRYAKLKAAGRLAPAGVARAPTHGKGSRPPAPPETIPRDLAAALRTSPDARRAFDAMPPSHQRRYMFWVDQAKRQDTRDKRIRETVRRLLAGERLGLK